MAYKKADSNGLFMLVKPTGARYWRLKYRFMSKEKLLASSIDPALAKQQQKHLAALSAENTFEAVTREWPENNKGRWSQGYAENILHRMQADMFPVVGRLSINTISSNQARIS